MYKMKGYGSDLAHLNRAKHRKTEPALWIERAAGCHIPIYDFIIVIMFKKNG